MRWARTVYLFIVLLALPAGVLEGQPPDAPSESAPPRSPVSVAQILPEASKAEIKLKEIQLRLYPDPSVISVQNDLPALQEEFDQWWASRQKPLEKTLSLKITHAIANESLVFQTRSAEWNHLLESRSKKIDAYLKELAEYNSAWKAIKNAAASEYLPDQVTQRISYVLAFVAQVEAQAKEQRDSLLSLQQQVTQLQAEIRDAQKQIATAEKELGARLFRVDSPFLWSIFSTTETPTTVAEQFESVTRNLPVVLRQFLAINTERIVFHALILLVLTIILIGLRRRLTVAGGQEGGDESAVHILRYPFSAALLVSLLLTPLIYSKPPAIVPLVATMLLVVPVFRLLPPLLPARVRWIVYVLGFLFVLEMAQSFLPEESILRRLSLLLLTILGIVAFWYAKHISEEKRLIHLMPPAVASLTAVVLPVLLVCSLLANVTGRVALSDLLINAVLGSCYVAVVLYGGVRVMGALATVATPQLAQWSKIAQNHGELLRRRLDLLFRVSARIMWVFITMHLFRVLRPAENAIGAFLRDQFSIGSTTLSPGNIVAFALTVLVAYWFSRTVRFVLQEEIFPRVTLARGIPDAISLLTYYMLLLVGFLLALAAAGFDVSRITILVSAFGVGIGFGLQDIVHNFVSGLILIFERPIGVGDLVQQNQRWGWIKQIGFRATVITTVDGADVVVPNSELTSQEVVNWSRTAKPRRGDISVPVAYGTDFHQAALVLKEAARNHPDVLAVPEPEVLLDQLDQGSLKLTLRFFTRLEVFIRVSSELTAAVYDALKTAGIKIPFPQRDLHLHWSDPDKANLPDLKEKGTPQAE